MKSSAVAAALLSILAGFTVTPSTSAGQQVSQADTLEKTDLTNTQISLEQAQELCRRVHDSRIQTNHIYMWTEVKPTRQPEAETEQSTLTPGCFTAKYVACKGEPRYPLADTCGFFTLVPEKDCSSSSTGETGRPRRSAPTSAQQKITLDHGQAVQLCASLQNLPADTPFQIQYVPIKVDLATAENSAHLTDECIRWTHESCDNSESEQRTGEKCSKWNLKISSAPKCGIYSSFFSRFNSSQISRFPNPMAHKTDFILGGDAEGNTIAGVQNLLADSIQCTRDSLSITCQITPKAKGDRSKREVQIPVSRVKRHCCGLFGCNHCGSFFGARQLCDCSQSDPQLCNCCGVCDVHEYPSGCYGNCLY